MSESESENQGGAAAAVQSVRVRANPVPKNLEPHCWPLGTSGNPGGSRVAGAWYTEWINAMATYSDAEIGAVLRDRKAGQAKKLAAKDWRIARAKRRNKIGNYTGNEETDRIIDHTIGKATQKIEIEQAASLDKIDYSRLDPGELTTFLHLARKAMGLPELVEQAKPMLQ